jgi:hypothetical protein
MHLRENNIIVCDCGVELSPEITTATDYIKYIDGIATCSNCGASAPIEIITENVCTTCGQVLPQ